MHVDGSVPFNVLHGDLHPIGSQQDSLFAEDPLDVHQADLLTRSRSNINDARRRDLLSLRWAQHPVDISETPVGELPITFVGHTPVRHITVHNSYVHIDQGVSMASLKQPSARPPTVVDPLNFAHWLRGVAMARRQATAA